jgi:large subunit ribosomal protein L25
MEKITFQVKTRQNTKNKQLRREGSIPANMYQAGKPSVALECSTIAFAKLYRQISDNAIVYLEIDAAKTAVPVLVDEVQYDVFGKNIFHVVFRQVNLKEKIKAEIPVELVGEFDVADAMVLVSKDYVEVEALPTDLPEKFEIDQSQFKAIGDHVSLSDLTFDTSKVSLVLAEDEDPSEVVLVTVQEQQAEEVEEESTELVEPEVVGEKKEDAAEPAA